MKSDYPMRALIVLGLIALSACGSSSNLSRISGTASVDGSPVESGTIHFQSNVSSKSSGGATVTDGRFQVVSNEGFESGEYAVVLQAYRKTGRIFDDPQKGKVEVTASIPLKDSPKMMQVSGENAQDLSVDFTTASK